MLILFTSNGGRRENQLWDEQVSFDPNIVKFDSIKVVFTRYFVTNIIKDYGAIAIFAIRYTNAVPKVIFCRLASLATISVEYVVNLR